LFSAAFSPLAIFGGFGLALVGILLWGIGYATQDTLLKALVTTVLPDAQRNFAFGLYYGGYGIGWLIGSVVTGLLYDQSRSAMVIFAVVAQLLALPIFVLAHRLRS
jgi:MFS family permease